MKRFSSLMFIVLCFHACACSRPRNPSNPCPRVEPKDGEYVMDIVEEGDTFKACCKCNKGEYLKEFCRRGDPASTVCAPCEFDPRDVRRQFYMDEGPHMYRKCKKAAEQCSFPGYLRIPGSTTKEARCVLPHVSIHGSNHNQ